HERTSLFGRYRSQRATSQFGRGAEAAPGFMEAEATGQRVQQLTQMLKEDLPEAIGIFKRVIRELREALSARYPGRQFISPRRIDSDTAPP
ncbi:MAG: hypothetical protein ACREQZ_16160, partial [Woeseiaceae bacterium]